MLSSGYSFGTDSVGFHVNSTAVLSSGHSFGTDGAEPWWAVILWSYRSFGTDIEEQCWTVVYTVLKCFPLAMVLEPIEWGHEGPYSVTTWP